jgi:hypothetical protein
MWLPMQRIKRTENERLGVGKPDGRLAQVEVPGAAFRFFPDYAPRVTTWL